MAWQQVASAEQPITIDNWLARRQRARPRPPRRLSLPPKLALPSTESPTTLGLCSPPVRNYTPLEIVVFAVLEFHLDYGYPAAETAARVASGHYAIPRRAIHLGRLYVYRCALNGSFSHIRSTLRACTRWSAPRIRLRIPSGWWASDGSTRVAPLLPYVVAGGRRYRFRVMRGRFDPGASCLRRSNGALDRLVIWEVPSKLGDDPAVPRLWTIRGEHRTARPYPTPSQVDFRRKLKHRLDHRGFFSTSSPPANSIFMPGGRAGLHEQESAE